MSEFKNHFNHVFQEAPSFSKQAREQVISQLHTKRKKYWMPISISSALIVAAVALILWNAEFFKPSGGQVSLFAPEHEDQTEIFFEVIPDHKTQFGITNQMNSMNRGKEEYKGGITIDTQFEAIEYGQVLFLEDGMEGDTFKFVLGRVIGKPGDKVAIDNGQLYLNDLPIQSFYGKAHIMGTTDVDEAFDRLQRVNSTERKQTIEEALHYSLEPFVLKENELFVVSDNWARNSVRKTFTYDQIEGVVLGYSKVVEGSTWPNEHQLGTSGMDGWRQLNEEELKMFSEISKQFIEETKYQHQNTNLIAQIANVDHLSDEIVEHQVTYYSYADFGNAKLIFEKIYSLGYIDTEWERKHYLQFRLSNGKWVFAGEFHE